ncbi:DMT family transporter [Brevibacterium yomogidense]|uniref:Ethidium bromide-methyl viologen resistance protein EmrE n=1 Tax=Brevibacterium yomogidense TaxID=946573 RepID=A0A1X6X5U3_9MICO|nr:SMR family transporter [Brevibacterium yomogidense]SLM94580.1 Ethidium bromide-methyl viologen resistance protein EmrE [Brevibacterium yomogidense]
MTAWLLLAGAIVLEVLGTLALRMGSHDSRLWYIAVGVFYTGAFSLLALVLAQGMPLGVAYGIWSAVGVSVTAVLGRVLFKEPFTWLSGLGIVLIVGGVLLVETGAA